MKMSLTRLVAILSLFVLLIPAFAAGAGPSLAQSDSRLFPETGKTVKGRFLKYWDDHGGLAQQGYPISEEMQEVSETNGKTYLVQYFERAVFEYHPDEKPEFQVLLSLLGVFFYQQKYGAAGAPNQTPNNEAGSVLVPETGKRLGGIFLKYWQSHGGLPQQGYPISDEFNEVSALNGQTYKVQYFERAVFEYHPEEKPEFQVLLSQLGTFQYRRKYLTPTATPVPPSPTSAPATPTTAPTSVPTTPPQPTTTPVPSGPCSNIPPSPNVFIAPSNCEKAGTLFGFLGRGFQPNESIGVYITRPDGSVDGAPFQIQADSSGISEPVFYQTRTNSQQGIWAITMEGVTSRHKAIGYFKLIP